MLKVNLVIALAEPEPSLGQAEQLVTNIYQKFDINKGSLVRVSSHAFTNILYVDTTFHRFHTLSRIQFT